MKTIFWAYLSRATSIGSSLVIMPFALSLLSAEEFNLWMVYVAFFGLLVVFDFGLTPSLSRQYSYLLAGAQSIEKVGSGKQTKSSINFNLLSNIHTASVLIYGTMAILATLILSISYTYYIKPIAADSNLDVMSSWAFYALSILISIGCFHFNSIFIGTNNLSALYKASSISNITFFSIAIYLIYIGEGLLGIGIARFVSSVTYAIYSYYVYYNTEVINQIAGRSVISEALEAIKKILPNTAKVGTVSLGNFLASKGVILISASYLAPSESASFAFTLNIFTICTSVALVYMSIKTPLLNSYFQKGEKESANRVQSKIYVVSISLCTLFSLSIILFGDEIIRLIKSQVELPSGAMLTLFFAMSLTECIRTISMNFISTGNRIPFFIPCIATGLGILIVTYLCFTLGYNSMLIPVLSILVLQSIFNNWYWTFYELKSRK